MKEWVFRRSGTRSRSFWGTQKWTLWVLLQLSHTMVQSVALAYLPAKSQLNSTRQEDSDSHPLFPIATTFPWIMLLWPHPYTPWGGSFSAPKANVCLSWTSLLADWSRHPREHPANPKGHCGCACRFADLLSVLHTGLLLKVVSVIRSAACPALNIILPKLSSSRVQMVLEKRNMEDHDLLFNVVK